MTQVTYSARVEASVDNLWPLLLIEIKDPKRFDPSITSFEVIVQTQTQAERVVVRARKNWREHITIHPEAFMVEHERKCEDGRTLTLIHQIVPDNDVCDLNLALNGVDRGGDSSDIQPLNQRGDTLKRLAEALSQ